jgi:hypothetical protein
MNPPPPNVYDLVARTIPGSWPLFYALANQTLVRGDQITSWYRSAHTNLAVGGVESSQHQVGWALDVRPRAGDFSGLESRARAASSRSRTGKVWMWGYVLREPDHVHVQLYPADRSVTTYVRWVVNQLGT